MSISLLSGPQDPSQLIGTINGVINEINSEALIGASAPTSLRNAIIGGDFTSNPWQRGTSFTSISNTLTYTADRFWALGGASSSISVSKQTSTPPPGFGAMARFGRAAANADVDPIKFGQVLTTNASYRFQGQPFVISFYARAGANFSAASAALTVTVASGTGTDETSANFAAGSWTGYAASTLYNQAGAAGAVATLTTSFQRFAFSGVIPTAATQVGMNFVYTPVGTAGASDYIEIVGVQLELMPQGGVQPTPFEWRPKSMEEALCYAYYYRANEAQNTAKQFQGQVLTTSTAAIMFPFPVPMRAVTTTSVAATTITQGTWGLTTPAGTLTNSLASSSGLAFAANSFTTRSAMLTATQTQASLTAAGDGTFLIAAAGTGTISVSAEL